MTSEQSKKQLKTVKNVAEPPPSSESSERTMICPCPTSAPVAGKVISTSVPTQTSNDTSTAGSESVAPPNRQSTKSAVRNSDASQLCSTLAIGQLIASNKPSAGSRLVANELRILSNTIKEESKVLRKEITSLAGNFATTLKTLLDEDREQQSMGNLFSRRPIFGQFPFRRVPVFRRPRRVSLQFARKSVSNASTNTSPPNTSPGPSMQSISSATIKEVSQPAQNLALKSSLVASKSTTGSATGANSSASSPMSASQLRAYKSRNRAFNPPQLPPMPAFKSPWYPSDQSASSYDGETDTDSTETSPGSPS